jgi:signal transduction histidine kinase
MRAHQTWLGVPWRVIWSFLLLLLLPAAAVGWLGMRWIEQDRQLESNQIQERRVSAADLVVADLDRALSATERQLAGASSRRQIPAGDDAVAVTIDSSGLKVVPSGRLYYSPVPFAVIPESSDAFAATEALELRAHDYAAAAAAYRAAAHSSTGDPRAAALVRLARTLRKIHRPVDALAAYDELIALEASSVSGLPADLVGRRARAALLAELGRREELAQVAVALQRDLLGARWTIDRGAFESYLAQVDAWLGATTVLDPQRVALTEAVEWLARERTRESFPTRGRRAVRVRDVDVTVLWIASSDEIVALAADPEFVKREWTDAPAANLVARGFDLWLNVADSNARTRPSTPAGGSVQRAATETGLPWTVSVTDQNDSVAEGYASRRQTVAAALALIFVVVLASAFVMARSVARELAVARLQSDFVSAVSHEFRTPLTSLRQFTALLNDEEEPPSAKRRVFYQAQARATDRLERLVESLLDFGRMEAGARPYRMEAVDAGALVRDVVGDFSRDALPEGFHVELSTADGGAIVAADPEAMARALRNLLENAVKYSGDARHITVDLARRNGELAINVRDRGLGIPREEQRAIFNKFVRGSATHRLGLKGTGIGLAMVGHIVQAHGGRVTVESTPGDGSTFTIWLPAPAPEGHTAHAPHPCR